MEGDPPKVPQMSDQDKADHDARAAQVRDTQIANIKAYIETYGKSTDVPETNVGSQGSTTEPAWHYEEVPSQD